LQGDLGPDLRSTLEMIRRNVELEARLIDDLLDVSRVAHGGLDLRIERLDVHAKIRGAVDACRGDCQAAGLAIVLDLSAPSHHVDADPGRMIQVFWNLIRNAAQFTPAPGSLAIRTLVEAGDGTRGDRLVVEFRDDGRGIAAEMLPRIFDPFDRGDGARHGRGDGLGLGLSIARAIAEAHGGRLTASSPGLGLGATFRLEQATAAPPAPVRDVEASAPSASAPAGGLRILLVEDNPDILRHAALALRLRGHEVTPAASLAAAREAGPLFDLLICDMELPDGRGTELMWDLRGRIPGIAVSGYSSEEDVQASLAAGFDDHLAKPVDIGRLEIAIRRAVPNGGPERE
ncbi:MAG: domain S-box, partial [Acidimicrobiales bacterium]|nr:domain S-box [Acidimicrobiales bacterium]